MKKVRIGVIGVGGMGSAHVRMLTNGDVKNAELVAVADIDPKRFEWINADLPNVKCFNTGEELIKSGLVDAVTIATPHYFHPEFAIMAMENGLDCLTEKPAGVYTNQIKKMNEVAEKTGRVFGIMFNQRSNPYYQKVKEIIESGQLGNIKRTIWIITSWYRTQYYYNSGGWRATWEGEGGGVLANQDPHQLDLWQWMCGMPKRVRAFCHFGKWHDIEVEDDCTAYVEYENGATGVFITTTGEDPGTNRLEISGDRGKLVMEGEDNLTFYRLETPEPEYNKNYKAGQGGNLAWKCEIKPRMPKEKLHHPYIMNNWVNAIINGTEMLAPGVEGINGVTLANAMQLSGWTDEWVDLPIDGDLYYSKLQEAIKNSTFVKATPEGEGELQSFK